MAARSKKAKTTKAEEKAPRQFVELGTSGLKIYGGQIREEWLPAMKGLKQRIEIFREMRDNDPTVGAILFAIEMLMRQVAWEVEPASEEEADQPAAVFVQECLHDMADTWDDTVASILSMLPFGFSLHELAFKFRQGPKDDSFTSKYSDNRIGLRRIASRAQETIESWDFNEYGDLVSVAQLAPPDWTRREMVAENLVLFRTTATKGNPEGRSVLRNAYRSWYLKKEIERIEAVGIERDLAGLPVISCPPEVLDPYADDEHVAQRQVFEQLIRNVRRDTKEGVMIPLEYDENGNPRYKFELMSTGGRRQFDTSVVIGRYDKRIAQTVLADFILLGQDKVGSFALVDSKTELFGVAIGAWLESICQVFNRDVIPKLLKLNTFDTSRGYPELTHGDIESIDLDKLGAFITAASGAGAQLFPDGELERHLRRVAGLPMPSEDKDELAARGGEPIDVEPAEPARPAATPQPDVKAKGIGVAEGIQSTLLNGAQVGSIVQVAIAARTGEISIPAAVAILQVSFGFDTATARSIVGAGG